MKHKFEFSRQEIGEILMEHLVVTGKVKVKKAEDLKSMSIQIDRNGPICFTVRLHDAD